MINYCNLNVLFLIFKNLKNSKILYKTKQNNYNNENTNIFLFKTIMFNYFFILKLLKVLDFFKSYLLKNSINPYKKYSISTKKNKIKNKFILLKKFNNILSLNFFYYIFNKKIIFYNNYIKVINNFNNFFPLILKSTDINIHILKSTLKKNFDFIKFFYLKNNSKVIPNINSNLIIKQPLKIFKKINFFKFTNNYVNILNYNYNYNFKKLTSISTNKIVTTKKLNLIHFLNYLLFLNDSNVFFNKKLNLDFLSNSLLLGLFNFFDESFIKNSKGFKIKLNSYNNYYPVLLSNKRTYSKYFSFYKNTYDVEYLSFTNKFVISFLEKNFKRLIYIKYSNNYFNNLDNYFLKNIFDNYKRFQPAYWRKFLVKDFIEILWYSFFLKDMSMISEWISIFMETLNFKNHKKFINFFLNFIKKNSDVFMNILKIKGFYFDIRGKVGVTGSSKKRHLCFKFGSINKSSKNTKINFNQSLVRTYSGVMGLTYIINY